MSRHAYGAPSGPSPVRGLGNLPWRRLATLAALALVGALAAWVLGWRVSPSLLASLVAAGVIVACIVPALPEPDPVEWPDPAPVQSASWFGLDPGVRRLARVVEASANGLDAEPLRRELRDEVARRLVAHHGASPDDPLASARGVVAAPLLHALEPGTRITRRSLPVLLDHLEEL